MQLYSDIDLQSASVKFLPISFWSLWGEKKDLFSLCQFWTRVHRGYQLLARMGYQAGQGLGAEGKGLVDPIAVEVRCGRGGLGVEDRHKKKRRLREEKRIGEGNF